MLYNWPAFISAIAKTDALKITRAEKNLQQVSRGGGLVAPGEKCLHTHHNVLPKNKYTNITQFLCSNSKWKKKKKFVSWLELLLLLALGQVQAVNQHDY